MIDIGRMECAACLGVGNTIEAVCRVCDGLGQVWQPGGPRFGALIELGARRPGEVVELATGHRGRVLWHMPRKHPDTTFVGLIDDFDGSTSDSPTPVASSLGVVSVVARAIAATTSEPDELHAGEKDSDAVDPLAVRARRAGDEGPLL